MNEFDGAMVANPFEPIYGPREKKKSSSVEISQRERRAEILAVTRRLLSEDDGGDFTLRNVADRAGVALQTVRNNFGRRDELMVAAVNEHTTSIWNTLAGEFPGTVAFMNFPKVIHHVASLYPGFLRATISSAFSQSPALRKLQRHASAYKHDLLRSLSAEDRLRPGIDPAALAAQITRLDTILMYEWAKRGDSRDLLSDMVEGHQMLLFGALRSNN